MGTLVARALRLAAVACLLTLSSVALAGDLPLKGVYKNKQSARATEDAILRSDVEAARAMRARTALYVFVAESREDWERHVGPGLDDALSRSPGDLARFASGLPDGIRVLGPDIAGARVSFDVPADRGRGVVALHLPDLIRRGKADSALTNSRVPDQGRFLGGAEVKREKEDDGERLKALYVPSRPRPFEPRLPSVNIKDLPRDGRGDLVIWAGRAASGSDAEDLRDELRSWSGRDDLPTQPMRSFPGRDERLGAQLRSIRSSSEVLVAPDGWYKALSVKPSAWELERSRIKHPTRYAAGVAPVVALVEDDKGRTEERVLVVGYVALYAPLLLSPEEAPLYVGTDGKRFYEAVHGGEVPFLRDRDDVWFLRAHLDRWVDGDSKRGGGKGRTFRDARKQLYSWADRYRIRGADRAARNPLPFRYESIPSDELEEMVDRRRVARGRVFSEDLAAWLKHWDSKFEKGDLEASYALGKGRDGASAKASLGVRARVTAVATRTEAPPESVERDESVETDAEPADGDEGGLVKASDLGFGGAGEGDSLDLDDRGWEESDSGGSARSSYGFEAGRMGGSLTAAAEVVAGIDIRDLYTTSSVCRIGGRAEAGIEVRVSGLPEGELESVRVEWDLMLDGRSVRRDAFGERRESGIHELEWEVDCPDSGGDAELAVAVFLGDDGPSDEGTLELDVRSGGGRSYARLSMPAAKRCIEADLDLDSDEEFGMSTSMGLSAEQIGAAVRGFQEETLRCYEEVPDAAGTVQIELTVGCDGRVSDVVVMDETVGDETFVQCVADTMRYAPFPAHDREAGAVFEMPLRYE